MHRTYELQLAMLSTKTDHSVICLLKCVAENSFLGTGNGVVITGGEFIVKKNFYEHEIPVILCFANFRIS